MWLRQQVKLSVLRGQLTRIPGTTPSGFGRSVHAPRIGTVNPRRHPKAVEPHCHQGRPGAERGPGTAMLAVRRVHTLCMLGQLTTIPRATPSGFGRSVRAPRIGITGNPRRHPKAVEPRCHQGRPGEEHGPGTAMVAVGRVHTLAARANSLEYLEQHPVALGEAYAHRV